MGTCDGLCAAIAGDIRHPVAPNKDMAGDVDMGLQASFWLWFSEA